MVELPHALESVATMLPGSCTATVVIIPNLNYLSTRIAKAVTDKLKTKELEGLTSVVMVGGFSGSVHVQVHTLDLRRRSRLIPQDAAQGCFGVR